jgi:hypothetical protein
LGGAASDSPQARKFAVEKLNVLGLGFLLLEGGEIGGGFDLDGKI